MANTQVEKKPRKLSGRTSILRAIALTVMAASVIVVLLAARDAQGREQASDDEIEGYELTITAPVEIGGFAESTIWSLPGQHLQLYSIETTPTVGLASVEAGAIVGLENAQGLVALAVVPPGLADQPDELLISPASTALAIAALHPEVTAGDTDTYLARLAVAARSDAFAEVAASVDGSTPLAQWGPDEKAAVQAMITDVVAASASVEPTCAGSEVVGGPVVRCPGSRELQNLSTRSVAVADSDGALCAIAPPASLRVTAADHELLRELVGVGSASPAPVGAVAAGPRPGVVEAQACGGQPQAFVDAATNPAWLVESGRVGTWIDDSLATARYLGPVAAEMADVAADAMTATNADPLFESGSLNASERLRAATRVVASPAGTAAFGVLPLTAEASSELDHLADLLERLFA